MYRSCLFTLTLIALFFSRPAPAAPVKVPAGLFKDVNDTTIGQARLVRGTQLFIDDWLIESLEGVRRQLNQPVKHKRNPVLVKDKPWEQGFGLLYPGALYDPHVDRTRIYYTLNKTDPGPAHYPVGRYFVALAESVDGFAFEKPEFGLHGWET